MIDILSSLHHLMSTYANTPSADTMLEMFCTFSPVAGLVESTVPNQSVDHSNDVLYEIELDVDGPNMTGYIKGMAAEFLIVECAGNCSNTFSHYCSDSGVFYVPLHDVLDVREIE